MTIIMNVESKTATGALFISFTSNVDKCIAVA